MTSSVTRTLAFDRPVHLQAQLGPLRRGAGDPTWVGERGGAIWRASRTPDGWGVERLSVDPAARSVVQATFGPGADWLAERLPQLLGAGDDTFAEFVPPELLLPTYRRFPGLRVGATMNVAEAAAAAVLEQKVTGKEAWFGWRYLVKTFGEVVTVGHQSVMVPPSPREWTQIPSWQWHKASVDSSRSQALIRVMRAVPEFATPEHHRDVAQRMSAVRGIGIWTTAEVSQRALGDADAVSFADYHLAKEVVYVFTGRRDGTDEQMAELLEPWRGHRYRVQRLVELSGRHRPRRGPRMSVADRRSY